jgi:predicted Fe-S protein YdhL (DUF1289 family)
MPIESPCNKVCVIEPRSGFCRGCGRNLDEIARWTALTDDERRRVIAELPRRLSRMQTLGVAYSA